MIAEIVQGERRSAPNVQTAARSGAYTELIVNDVGLGRYFEAARTGRLYTLSTALGATLNGMASPLAAGGTPQWALYNPQGNSKSAVILKATCQLICGASATPVLPVWNFLTNLTAMTALGSQASISAGLSTIGNPGSMRSYLNSALTGGTGASVLLRPWMGSYNDPRHVGAVSETSAGVIVEETEGSIIVPPNTILSVTFNAAGAAVTGSIAVLYAEIDWPI